MCSSTAWTRPRAPKFRPTLSSGSTRRWTRRSGPTRSCSKKTGRLGSSLSWIPRKASATPKLAEPRFAIATPQAMRIRSSKATTRWAKRPTRSTEPREKRKRRRRAAPPMSRFYRSAHGASSDRLRWHLLLLVLPRVVVAGAILEQRGGRKAHNAADEDVHADDVRVLRLGKQVGGDQWRG